MEASSLRLSAIQRLIELKFLNSVRSRLTPNMREGIQITCHPLAGIGRLSRNVDFSEIEIYCNGFNQSLLESEC